MSDVPDYFGAFDITRKNLTLMNYLKNQAFMGSYLYDRASAASVILLLIFILFAVILYFIFLRDKDEAKMILETEVLADNNPEYSHPNFKNDPGNNTKDMLFVLSLSEVMNYFPKEKDRTCYPTPFANKRASNREKLEKGIWWLRTPGDYYGSSAVVERDGRFNNRGFDVNYDLGVRPAMWVKI